MKKICKILGVFTLSTLMCVTLLPASITNVDAASSLKTLGEIVDVKQDGSDVILTYQTGEKAKVSVLKEGVLRFNMEPTGEFKTDPVPKDESHVTKIVDKNEDEYLDEYQPNVIVTKGSTIDITTEDVTLSIDSKTSQMKMLNNGNVVFEETKPLQYTDTKTIQTLATNEDEYYFGGGQQNGYFSHKGRKLAIENKSTWVNGGVSSPNPFYMSNNNYGVLRHTFESGTYDFTGNDEITLTHKEERFDAFYFVEDDMKDVISDYTELTGSPAMMPKYGFYEGNANCYNKPDQGQTINTTGLNVAQSYVDNDMPYGWFLPNDGYGCGYGGIDNLKTFVDNVSPLGFTTGLWTENDLDKLASEVKDAGTRMIKTDVRWVGEGYSFGLNAVRQAFEGIEDNSTNRGFVISLDGWAGTQRYATIWSGDQTGGNWEYIRFHIPTYIGAGLSGQPNVGSDLDGIYGGSAVISTRDFQWKTFTPIMINMSGWSDKDKNPWVWGGEYEQINRMYLKLKSQLLPYYYTYARESYESGVPMIRALALEYSNDAFTMTNKTQYEYLWGENMLVAPVYSEADNDAEVRNNIYLPDENQVWIDYFSGEQYTGGKVINNVSAPLWKLPLFIKSGAIIPMNVENNTIEQLAADSDRVFEVFPDGSTTFTMYDDDGKSQEYKTDQYATTKIDSVEQDGDVTITVNPSEGAFTGMAETRGNQFIVRSYTEPQNVTANINGTETALTNVQDKAAFEAAEGNVYYYDEDPIISEYYEGAGSGAAKLYVKLAKTNVRQSVSIHMSNVENRLEKEQPGEGVIVPAKANAPVIAEAASDTIRVAFDASEGNTADLFIDGTLYENVTTPFLHDLLSAEETHTYQLRYTNVAGSGEWSDEVSATTMVDPYRNVIKDATATANSFEDIPGDSYPPQNLVDGDLSSQWYSNWDDGDAYVNPKIITVDLQQAYELDKMEYINDGTSQIRDYEIQISKDGINFRSLEVGNWVKQYQNNFDFQGETARYIRIISNDKRFNSGNELRIYKVDGTDAFNEADCNNDKQLDDGDLTFLKNYVGVGSDNKKLWDQVKAADFNCNELIDAYDLMFVASRLSGGVMERQERVGGQITLSSSVKDVKAGETFTINIDANNFKNVYALDYTLLMDPAYITSAACSDNVCTADSPFEKGTMAKNMLDYSKSGMITVDENEQIRFFGTFSYKGNETGLSGNGTVATLKLKALKDLDVSDLLSNTLQDAQVIASGYVVRDATKEDVSVQYDILEAAIRKGVDIIEKGLLTGLADKVVTYFNASLDHAIAVLGNTNATGEELQNAWAQLADAMHYLDFKADKTQLNALIEECAEIDLTLYEEAGKTEFIAALATAKSVSENENALADRITSAYLSLIDAKANLKLVSGQLNKTNLQYMLQKANDVIINKDYYEQNEMWTTFITMYDAAADVFANATTQEAIDEAANKLASAYEDIRLVASEERLAELSDFVSMIQKLNEADYTTEAYAYMISALTYANELQVESSFTMARYEEFRVMKAQSEYLMVHGKVVSNPSENPSSPVDKADSAPSQTPEDNKNNAVEKPQGIATITGDTTNTIMLIGAMMIALGAGAIIMNIRRRTKKS